MRFDTLDAWLTWQEGLHPAKIDLGLARIGEVARRMDLLHPPFPVISIAGTNGKGSSVALLEAMLRAGGHRTGAYTSPHILRYNERVRVNGEEVPDEALCAAFEAIDRARGEISLSYFEFGTLAALYVFHRQAVDVALMEVGLGGRLDATNILDADVALITSIGIDHVQWLGNDRESIAREKAGIMRANRPVVCADADPPQAIAAIAQERGARLYQAGRDYRFEPRGGQWQWHSPEQTLGTLPPPALAGAFQLDNAAGVLMVLQLVHERLPLGPEAIEHGLRHVRLAGRFQCFPGEVEVVLDVAHNPDSAAVLAHNLDAHRVQGLTHAVFSALDDKDLHGILQPLVGRIESWWVAALDNPRALDATALAEAVEALMPGVEVRRSASIVEAFDAVRAQARAGDRIIVFGSFYTVAQVYPHIV